MSVELLQGWGSVLNGEQEIAYGTYTISLGSLLYARGILILEGMEELPVMGLQLRLDDGRVVAFVVTDASAGAGIYRIQVMDLFG